MVHVAHKQRCYNATKIILLTSNIFNTPLEIRESYTLVLQCMRILLYNLKCF